jgi:proline dehydrogenase
MLRRSLLWLSEQPAVFRFARRNRLARRFARRFVAGETVEEAIGAARELAGKGITTTLDLLGESVAGAAAAQAARDEALRMLDLLGAEQGAVEVNISVKLTQLGFDVGEGVARANLVPLLERAKALDGFVRIDMEGSEYTQRTLDLFTELFPAYGPHVGVVIQSCLRRSAEDVERLIALGARVRLCKGAYREPPDVAFPDKRDVDRQYAALMEALLARGRYPAIATHDEAMLAHARRFAADRGIAADRFEFQMLYGVRRDLQARLRADGFRLRVYVPFGAQWYPYLMRRLAERPANIAFILGNLVKEGLSRR